MYFIIFIIIALFTSFITEPTTDAEYFTLFIISLSVTFICFMNSISSNLSSIKDLLKNKKRP